MSSNNIWTGERLETFVYNENTLEHLHRYALASTLVEKKTVLDIACGEGYGSNILSKIAEKVYGVDIDDLSISRAKNRYQSNNLHFIRGSIELIPIEDNSVDVVVSFETLEHHDQHEKMIKEIKRVLKPNGILIISTPEKENYSDKKAYVNPFHVKELYFHEFKCLLENHFLIVKYYLQNVFFGSLMIPEKNSNKFLHFSGDYDSIEKLSDFNPMYVIAIASDLELDKSATASTFESKLISRHIEEERYRKARNEGAIWIKNSLSYKIGSLLLKPFKYLRALWHLFL